MVTSSVRTKVLYLFLPRPDRTTDRNLGRNVGLQQDR